MEAKTSNTLSVLSLSPLEEDHRCLEAIIGHSRWQLYTADKAAAARDLLRNHAISVVVCERDLRPGSWIETLEDIQSMSHPASLIVTSRLADDRLWSEALNLGAWDVLPKPFDRSEVLRSVKSAWQHWYNLIQPFKVMAVAS